MARIRNTGGVVNRGGRVTITGQAIGTDRSDDTTGYDSDQPSDNTGVVTYGGGTTVVRDTWVNGQYYP